MTGHPPRTKLPGERELAVRLGVSRPLVREAMRALSERGLIEVSPGRGAFTRLPDTTDLAKPLDSLFRRRQVTARQLVEARLMLECEAASLAAERVEDDELRMMRALLERLDGSVAPLDRAGADITFHTLVVRAAHNPVIEAMFASITPLTYELMVRSHTDQHVAEEGSPMHHGVLEALGRHDSRRARQMMSNHLSLALDRYGDDLDRSVDLQAQRELSRLVGRPAPIEEFLGNVEQLVRYASDASNLPPSPQQPEQVAAPKAVKRTRVSSRASGRSASGRGATEEKPSR